ncbi:MAG: aminopeptidase P family protein [Clostridiaceae bacterium]
MIQERLNKILKLMSDMKMPQMIVSDSNTIFYLTGRWFHTGERMIALYINLNGNNKLFLNELFPVNQDLGIEIVRFNDNQEPVSKLAEHVEKDKPIGIDKTWPSRFLLKLMELGGGSSFINGSEITDRVRMSKDKKERELMRASSRVNDAAVDKLIKLISPKYTEEELGQMLMGIYKEMGAESFSFDPIVAYGANASDPHHGNDNSTLKEGDNIVIDIGCRKDSYCSDMTRTVFYKFASEKSREVYEIVKEANRRGIEKVKPGAKFCDIDAAARDYIEEKGYGKYFTHRLGHSIGIEDHDFGDVSSVNLDTVEPGMIFSIEPGIYLPGDVGVRIEDLVLVTIDGCEVLNKYNKELTIIE